MGQTVSGSLDPLFRPEFDHKPCTEIAATIKPEQEITLVRSPACLSFVQNPNPPQIFPSPLFSSSIMACGRRSLTSNFTHLTRRFHPSFAHILRDDREYTEPSNPLPPSPPTPSRPHASSFAPSVSGFGGWRSLGFSLPLGLEPGLLRSYSSGAEEGSNEINYIKDVAEVLSDSSVETATLAAAAVPSPFPGEVAAAAADSFLPVAALQHLIDAVHSFSGLNWLGPSSVFT
ncbi:hypothetical protein BHE74_00032705 [Ensete ventricosum]|nr:hypothetical protein BHE74_00032705 [Ensete ventricosum]